MARIIAPGWSPRAFFNGRIVGEEIAAIAVALARHPLPVILSEAKDLKMRRGLFRAVYSVLRRRREAQRSLFAFEILR